MLLQYPTTIGAVFGKEKCQHGRNNFRPNYLFWKQQIKYAYLDYRRRGDAIYRIFL